MKIPAPQLVSKSLAVIVAGCVATLLSCFAAHAQSPVSLTLSSKVPGSMIAPDFIGLSFESEKVLPDTNGSYYFSPTNKALLALFKTLGVKSLRIGGNTADRPGVKVPEPADVDSLYGFARAADAKVIY